MAEHAKFTLDSGLQVYFCDPRSPWQRGSNENTNGLLRQYFPKRTKISMSQPELNEIAAQLDARDGAVIHTGANVPGDEQRVCRKTVGGGRGGMR